MLRFLKLCLATWRITSLLVQERGPYALFQQFRQAQTGETAKALECVWCTSLYVAVLVLLLDALCPRLVDVLALSSGAIALDRWNSQ